MQQFSENLAPPLRSIGVVMAVVFAVLGLVAGSCAEAFPVAGDAGGPGGDVALGDALAADGGLVDSAAADSVQVPPYDAGARPVGCPEGADVSSSGTMPSPDACDLAAPPWWPDAATPAATLQVEAGVLDPETGVFASLHDGQWAPIHWGMRQGAGFWTALRVHLPGETAAKVRMQLYVPGLIECAVVGTTIPVAYFDAVPGEPGVYQYGSSPGLPGACILLAFSPADVNALCDNWMTVHAAVRVPDTDLWGEDVHVVRLYIEDQGP